MPSKLSLSALCTTSLLLLGLSACSPPEPGAARPQAELPAAAALESPVPASEAVAAEPPVSTAPAALVTPQPPASTAPRPAAPEISAPAPAAVVCASCGTVRAINQVLQEGQGSGVGAVIGGLVGGLAGNQVGGGSGRKLATVAGVIGGAVAGNTIEKKRNAGTWYEVTVQMENGDRQVIAVPDASGISVGSAVTVQGGDIYLR